MTVVSQTTLKHGMTLTFAFFPSKKTIQIDFNWGKRLKETL